MKKVFYLQSTTIPENRFRIVKLDKERGVATLQRGSEAKFEHPVTQAELDKYHYKIERIDVETDDD